jgi:hypothetical protein
MTASPELESIPVGLSESQLGRAINRSVGWVASQRRQGRIVPICRLKTGTIVYHPTAFHVLESIANQTQTEK